MKGDDILTLVSNLEKPKGLVTDGPITIRAGINDARAAKLIAWLNDAYPDLTYGEAQDAIVAALWWIGFMAATPKREYDPPPVAVGE